MLIYINFGEKPLPEAEYTIKYVLAFRPVFAKTYMFYKQKGYKSFVLRLSYSAN